MARSVIGDDADGGSAAAPKTVRVWAASDLHGTDPAVLPVQPNGCHVAVLAGDICPLPDFAIWTVDEQPVWLNEVVGAWAASRPELHVVLVPGDHDVFFERRKDWRERLHLPPNVHLLIDSEADVCGLKFYGSPWVPWIKYSTYTYRFAFMAVDDIRERMWFDCIPKDTDVMVTHSAPRLDELALDCTLQYPTEIRYHHGSRELANAIRRVSPTLAVFGHVHTGDHAFVMTESGTGLRNVSVLDEDYRLAYNPAIIDVPIRRRP